MFDGTRSNRTAEDLAYDAMRAALEYDNRDIPNIMRGMARNIEREFAIRDADSALKARFGITWSEITALLDTNGAVGIRYDALVTRKSRR